MIEEVLDAPLRWRKPCRVFVASMSDPFHASVPDTWLDRMFAVIALADWHEFQLLTKRPERQQAYITDPQTPFRIQQAVDALLVDEAMRGHKEEWKSIAPDYEVSSFGNVRSLKGLRGSHLLKQSNHSQGYKQVALCLDGAAKTRLVHQLVLEAFDPALPWETETRHRNGNKADNRIANLLSGTKTENMQDAARHGTAGVWMKEHSTLGPDAIRAIRAERKRGAKLHTLAEKYGSSRQQISAICLGKIYKVARVPWPLPNLWLGVSVEDQTTLNRLNHLCETPAALRFASCEPLLEDLGDLTPWLQPVLNAAGLDWIICGGESGPRARPCHLEWLQDIVEQCEAYHVPVWMKQLGSRASYGGLDDCDGPVPYPTTHRAGAEPSEWPAVLQRQEFPHASPLV